MKYLSLASGIEAATVAWEPLGFEALAFSQYDPEHNYKNGQDFASQVLAHHYPNTANHGDMTKYKEWPDYEPDIIVGGTPCQAFSIAGLRKGLDDPRGNLSLTYLAIIKRYQPRWFIWENVPGVLSSNGGRDFGSFLAGIQKLGYGFAYRVLDAQHFGVPQRRRRVFVVGHISDHRRAAAVLFDTQSLSGNIKKSKKTRQNVTQTAGTLTANAGGLNRLAGNANELDFCIVEGQQHNIFTPSSHGSYKAGCGTLRAAGGDLGGGSENLLLAPNYYTKQSIGEYKQLGKSSTLSARDYKDATDLITEAIPIHDKATRHAGKTGIGSGNGLGIGKNGDPCPTLTTGDKHAVSFNLKVRRLLPIECERLQGFPDNYTQIPCKGKQPQDCHDGPRYKAIGNSMAVPVMQWLGKRIEMVDKIENKNQKEAQ
ncbi:Cytosine-specific methyltransferase [uncultured Thiomicrorhabdus sp.]